MGISSITRDWPAGGPAIVRITTSDSLATVALSGYLTAQAANIALVNNGPFEWADTDMVAVAASDGKDFFLPDALFTTLTPLPGIGHYTSVPISLSELINMYTTPKLLISAPAANELIILNGMQLVMTYGSVALAGGGVVAAQYDSTAHGAGVAASNTEAAADFFDTADNVFAFVGVTGALPDATTVQKGIYLSNQTGVFTGGTGTSFVAKLTYTVITV